MARFLLWVVTVCGIAFALPPSASLAPKDGRPARFAETAHTYAIGDLHGDVNALFRILLGLGLVDRHFRWIGGDAQVVLLGDLLDGAETSKRLLDAAVRLDYEARRVGGRMHRITGNHEMLAARGDGAYAETADCLAFESVVTLFFRIPDGLKPRARALAIFGAAFSDPRSRYAREIAERNTFLAIGPRVFVHAGVHDMWPKEAWKADLETLNSTVRREMRRLQRRERFSPEQAEHWIVEADGYGPLWTRDLVYGSLPASVLTAFLHRHDADTMVVGHTSLSGGKPEPRFDGKLWMADTKISEAYGDRPSALEFRRGVPAPIVHTTFPPGVAPDVPDCGGYLDETLWD